MESLGRFTATAAEIFPKYEEKQKYRQKEITNTDNSWWLCPTPL
jgi:hypothetical protein